MNIFEFWVEGTPVPQGSMRIRRGRIVHDNQTRLDWWRGRILAAAHNQARQDGVRLPLDGPLVVAALFILPKPASVRRKLPSTKPDLDKLVRALGDALSPVRTPRFKIIAEDSRIVEWRASKIYLPDEDAADGYRPGVNVAVWKAKP